MEFSVKRSDLLDELELTQGVVERKTTIPILSNLLVEAKGSRLTITATDLELSIRTSCEAKVKKEGAGTIPAKKLFELLRLLPEGEIKFKIAERQVAVRPIGVAGTHCPRVVLNGYQSQESSRLARKTWHGLRVTFSPRVQTSGDRGTFTISPREARNFAGNRTLLDACDCGSRILGNQQAFLHAVMGMR